MSIRFDLREGRKLGAPICCRWRWSIEYALNPDRDLAIERGIRFTDNGDEYVPCHVFHEAAMTHAEYEHLSNVPGTTYYARAQYLAAQEQDDTP